MSAYQLAKTLRDNDVTSGFENCPKPTRLKLASEMAGDAENSLGIHSLITKIITF